MKIILIVLGTIFFGNIINGIGWRNAVNLFQNKDE